MVDRVSDFVNSWISENVNAEGYPAEGDLEQAKIFAQQLLAEAKEASISKKEIESLFGDVVDYIANEINRANDDEVSRLAAKDD